MKVDGFHHVTAITADIDANLEFYGRLLGLRLVWQGVYAYDPRRGTSPTAMSAVVRAAWLRSSICPE